MRDIVIEIKDLSKIYQLYTRNVDRIKEALGLTKKKKSKDYYALNKINFNVYKGETVGIIGTNGSGKSTLLKIITGVLSPTHGVINVKGRISALLELGAGFNMEYTGIENIYLNGTMNGLTRQEVDNKLEKILEFADIGEFVYQPVKTYSSGMFVRLAFAVAINIDPEILIVDEALSVGDIFFQSKCYNKFEEFRQNKKTILFVSHDLASICKYCDKAILLNKGEKVIEGSTKEIVDIYKKILVNQYNDKDIQESLKQKQRDNNSIKIWKNKMNINPNYDEYGNGVANIMDFAILDNEENITSTIYKDSVFKIKMKVLFHKDIKNPIFAYSIKDSKGTEITGTNSMLEETNLESVKAGQEVIINFEQSMCLQGGQYLLSLGCTGFDKGEFVVYSRIYDACNIEVISLKNTIGFFDIHSRLSYENW